MGISQSVRAIISYANINDISNTFCKQVNIDLDQMEKGEEKNKTIIDIFGEKYWKDRKLYINYKDKSKKRCEKRKRDIIDLQQKLNIF
jgi:hypothetical protein